MAGSAQRTGGPAQRDHLLMGRGLHRPQVAIEPGGCLVILRRVSTRANSETQTVLARCVEPVLRCGGLAAATFSIDPIGLHRKPPSQQVRKYELIYAESGTCA